MLLNTFRVMGEEITKEDLRKVALIYAGYRDSGNDMWLKPFGNHLLIYDVTKRLWRNMFKGVEGQTCTWESKLFRGKPSELTSFIKNCEQDTSCRSRMDADFGFLTQAEKLSLML